jgi:hypothetical protein
VIAEQENAFSAFELTASAPARDRVAHAERLGADLAGAVLSVSGPDGAEQEVARVPGVKSVHPDSDLTLY